MKLHDSHSYGDADIDAVYSLITSEEFRTQAAVDSGGTEVEVTVEESDGGHTVTIVRTQPADMPDFVKKLTGETVKVKQTEQWGAPDPASGRTADVKVSIVGQPAEMVGKAVLFAEDGGTAFTLEGDVKVSIPFIGKKIEPEVAKAIKASLKHEVELGTSQL